MHLSEWTTLVTVFVMSPPIASTADLPRLPPLQLLPTLLRSLRMVTKAAPYELTQIGIFNLIRGAGPSLSLIFGKQVIDGVAALAGKIQPQNATDLLSQQPQLFWSIAALVGTNLFVESVSSIDTQIFSALRDRVQGYIEGEVIAKVATFNDIALFENPELLNILQLTEKGMQRMQRLAFIAASFFMGIFTLVPSVVLSAQLAWWVPLMLIGFAIPAVVIDLRYWKRSWRVEESQATLSREKGIYLKLLKDENYAKEIRLFSIQNLLLGRWRDAFERLFQQTQAVRREGTIAVMALSFLGGLGSSIPYFFVILGVLQGRFTLGDIALYTGIILQLKRSIYTLVSNLGDIYDVTLATRPVFQLLDLQPQLVDRLDARELPAIGNGLELKNLSFGYPGAKTNILNNISLKVNPGEMVVLVGENGAGKTTLGKLLARLYDPTSGEILWNGVDMRDVALDELRSRIAVVMQDYARFPAKVRENVGWGYLPKLNDDSAVHQVLAEAGINQVVLNLEQGLDNPLGKQLEHGIDLSGGQWQRVAIARALLRLGKAELVIFDEPTAALDPKNEHEIYEIFRTIARGRMAVVISHRLSLARMADRIVVLEQGEIVEQGNHAELMAQSGRYADMFTRQASSYID
jgi:ATP-binding cassette, subfamily B, bacterial